MPVLAVGVSVVLPLLRSQALRPGLVRTERAGVCIRLLCLHFIVPCLLPLVVFIKVRARSHLRIFVPCNWDRYRLATPVL